MEASCVVVARDPSVLGGSGTGLSAPTQSCSTRAAAGPSCGA
ncbi:hypothetical protein Ae406Ps2_6461 [Pseudonocardia sp. Ae406_Ps2]|nr:hypothetical protein Ae406Ps2_6461 [Pseudonocardia sp. Ae406_Ps2]